MSDKSTTTAPAASQFFSFGEERQISDAHEIISLFHCLYNGQFYELPFSINAHARYFHRLLYLRSALQVKVNILTSCLQKNALISKQEFEKFATDYVWFGNAYLERVQSRNGKLLALKHTPAKFTRRDKNNRYKFIARDAADWWMDESEAVHTFAKGSILHLAQPDVNQELYGVPEWLASVQSAQLNEAATKFRLRYYQNGSHAGYILYITDPAQNEDDIEKLKEQLTQSKGPGNFRNLLFYAPDGDKDGLKLIPISEVTAKDEFFNIKAVSRDDQLAAARVPPNIMGIVPTNTSGFGSIKDASEVFARNEVEPLQERFTEINEWLGQEVIRFRPYTITTPAAAPALI